MRIEVERVKQGVVKLQEEIKAADWDIDRFDVKFTNNIEIHSVFTQAGREILAEGKVFARRLITCSRCLEDVEQKVNHDFKLSYCAENLGTYLTIDKEVREEILLNFPMKVLCRPDCKGICSGCGVNLNYQSCSCPKKE
ncbi:MAG: DUF177 domain-containing protein [Candidatus Omnitrophota bacterium]